MDNQFQIVLEILFQSWKGVLIIEGASDISCDRLTNFSDKSLDSERLDGKSDGTCGGDEDGSLDGLTDRNLLTSNNGTSESFINVCRWNFIRHEKNEIMSRLRDSKNRADEESCAHKRKRRLEHCMLTFEIIEDMQMIEWIQKIYPFYLQ